MSLPGTIDSPSISEGETDTSGGWIVTVYNNDDNTPDEVIDVLMRATECNLAEAEMETWEIHHLGKSVVHHGQQQECQRAASIIARIGIKVEVTQE
jgi:ATP-dependent Clp protease adapter protein ClpS